jgi:hypothetical protein
MGAPQREWGTLIQPLKKPTINHPPVILKSYTVTRAKNFRIFYHHLQLTDHFEDGFNKDLQN